MNAATPDSTQATRRIAEARALLPKDKATGEFFDALYAGAADDDILQAKPDMLAGLAKMALAEARKHVKGGIEVTLHPGPDAKDPQTILIAVNDDRPFLFDSALPAALAAGARVHAVFHPMVVMGGQPTSVIVLALDTVLGEAGQGALTDNLRAAFLQGAEAVRDWKAMLARLKTARDELATRGDSVAEDVAFLDWLADNHFTFLGARDYVLASDGAHGRLEADAKSNLGVLSDSAARVLRRPAEFPELSREVRAYLDEKDALIVTKSNARSLVHRRAHMDYVGVKRFDAAGKFIGEHRFVGLFTSSAYSLRPQEIPLLRHKVRAAMQKAGFAAASHDGKALVHILDTFPRDELFQISESELFDTAMGILKLGGRARVKLFLRFDRFDRFVSVLMYAPRDHLNSNLRRNIHAMLAKALDGRTSAATSALYESALMRVHYIIGRNEGPRPHVDVAMLEHRIAEMIKTWDDYFLDALCARHGRAGGLNKLTARAARFSPAYRGTFPAHDAARDLEILEDLSTSADPLKVKASAYWKEGDAHSALRLKLYVLGDVLPLSVSLPIFENLGLKVIAEDAFPLSFKRDDGWPVEAVLLDFKMERANGESVLLDDIRAPLEDVFHAVLRGQAESDGFNRLVIGVGLSWRDVTILRAIAKFLRQAAMGFSQDYMEQALARNPAIASMLAALFHARLDPNHADEGEAARITTGIETALGDVPSLDDDRILRRFRNVIASILRTSYYRADADTLAIKLDSRTLDELPAPRPWREIFVYSPAVEGVHLRFGRIARGGLRWSDRREDFRTEVLGLVKAQQVKNAVIVPVGAKGGFFPKAMPANPSRDEFMATGVAAYKLFIKALLDVTDNLKPDGSLVPPLDVLRLDDDDPYLVVAADKGTATFSDIANGIAEERGFWLGDAFASGGSHGYDHKKMGITARGAWEAVKRHFREMGRDIQKEDFTVIGVGDMSGDVFGNGMLLSEHIRLLAAFDHRHIFLDPNAETEKPFAERQRLFALPRSSWDDYNKSLIGKGGGVFARNLKEIPLPPEVKAMLGVTDDRLAPTALIKALLKAKADLLWFGGIGTYIKSAAQNNLDVGDRANDPVRINGAEVGAKVVGEGANLGATQLGRMEYTRAGGRINTDAVDNSAGVDTSDHEVNLKILLSGPYRRGELDGTKRDALLTDMTDAVADHVLADNYDQTLALSVAEAAAPRDLDAAARFIRALEARGKLDRAVEFLPSDVEIRKLENEGKGLTRPELAVLLAYAKLDLDAEILESKLPDDPALAGLLTAYFPPQAAKAFPSDLAQHRLRREIISTSLSNRIVNLAGPLFVSRMQEMSGASGAEVARAFALAQGAFGLGALKTRIDALDGKVKSELQIRLHTQIAEMLRRLGLWFLTHVSPREELGATIARYKNGVDALRADYRAVISQEQADEADARIAALTAVGVEDGLARDVGLLSLMGVAPEIAQLARDTGQDFKAVATLYFGVGALLGLDRLRQLAGRISAGEHWDRLAIRRLVDDLFAAQRVLSQSLLSALPKNAKKDAAMAALTDWEEKNKPALERTVSFLAALETSGDLSIAKLTLANSQVHKLADI